MEAFVVNEVRSFSTSFVTVLTRLDTWDATEVKKIEEAVGEEVFEEAGSVGGALEVTVLLYCSISNNNLDKLDIKDEATSFR